MFMREYQVIVLSSLALLVLSQVDDTGQDGWLDPGDMLNYDSGAKKMVNKPNHKTQQVIKDTSESCNNCDESRFVPIEKYQTVESNLDLCLKEKQHLTEEEELLETCDGGDGMEGIFFRQYVRSVLLKYPHEGSYQTQITLSEEDRKTLNKFATPDSGRVEDAHHVLSNMADFILPLENPLTLSLRQRIETFIGIDLSSLTLVIAGVMMCSITVSVIVRIRVPWSQFLWKLVITLFVVSIPWNWWYLYKNAVASRQADLLKDVPRDCNPKEQSAGQSLVQWIASSFTFSSDECAKYHQRLLVDPFWEVPPTQALAVTMTKFFLEPLKHIGVEVKLMIRGLLEDMPITMWPVVIFLFIFLTALILVLICGYRISFFWNVFGLEPGRAPSAPQPPPSAIQQPTNVQPIQFVVQGATGVLPLEPENLSHQGHIRVNYSDTTDSATSHRQSTVPAATPALPCRTTATRGSPEGLPNQRVTQDADCTASTVHVAPTQVQTLPEGAAPRPDTATVQQAGGDCKHGVGYLESSGCESLQPVSLPVSDSTVPTPPDTTQGGDEESGTITDPRHTASFTAPGEGATPDLDTDDHDSLSDQKKGAQCDTTVATEPVGPSTHIDTQDDLSSFEFLPSQVLDQTDSDSEPTVEDLGSREPSGNN